MNEFPPREKKRRKHKGQAKKKIKQKINKKAFPALAEQRHTANKGKWQKN